MLLSHTQHHGVLGVAQLQYCHLHIGNGVARLVEVVSCSFVQVGVPNISQVFLHPPCIGSCRNSYIIHLTFWFGALDVVHIEPLHFAVDFSILHSPNPTLSQSHTLPIQHSSNLTL